MLGSELPDRRRPTTIALAGAMLLDYRSYLRDNLLVKVDRATMLSSVEARAPFLDRDVTRFALSLPRDLRVTRLQDEMGAEESRREVAPEGRDLSPQTRPERPVASWINRGLRAEVDRLLAPERLRAQGLIDETARAGLLAEHRSGHANHAKPLWAVIMLQYWLEKWASEDAFTTKTQRAEGILSVPSVSLW